MLLPLTLVPEVASAFCSAPNLFGLNHGLGPFKDSLIYIKQTSEATLTTTVQESKTEGEMASSVGNVADSTGKHVANVVDSINVS